MEHRRFSMDVVREVRSVRFAGNEIECAIDYGVIAARKRPQSANLGSRRSLVSLRASFALTRSIFG